MRKILMVILALVMTLTLVIGSAGTVSAASRPVRTAVAVIDSVNATGFYIHWMWNGYGAWGYQLLIYDLDDSAGANYTMPVSWQEKRTTYMASIHYPNPVNYGYAGLPPNPTHDFAIQLTLFKKNGAILEQVSGSWSPPTPTYTVTFNETTGLSGVDIGIYDEIAEEYLNTVTTNDTGQATIKLPNGEYRYEATKSGYAFVLDYFTVSGSAQTISFTMNVVYEVTFHEANDLQYVYIEIYNSSEKQVGDLETDASGNATIDLPNGTYLYGANKTGYASVSDDFTVSGSAQTISFTMNVVYTVTFNETHGLAGVEIGIYDYIAEQQLGYVTTNETGQATIDLPNSDYNYYTSKSGYASVSDDFTVSGSAQTINFTISPTYTVTFDEANDLQYVYIDVYNSGEKKVGELETDASGNATIDLPNDTYDFYASMSGYMGLEGNFTVSGENLTVPFEMNLVPFVTFNETNGLSDVYIKVYEDSALANFMTSLWTDQFGQGTMEIYESGTYYYEAMVTGYGDLVGDFTVSVSNITESFTMNSGYIVEFQEANSVAATLQLFSDSSLTIPASSPFTTNSEGYGSREVANSTYYYKAMRVGFNDCTGNFTVSGGDVYEYFEMIPMAGVIFAEDFTSISSGLPVGWTTNASSICHVENSNMAGGYAPELGLHYTGGSETYSDYYVATPPINATGTSTALNLSFKSYFDLYGDDPEHPYTYAVQTSDDDGATWTTVLEESPTLVTYPDGYFQRTESIDISACAGKTFRICWRLYGYTWWMDDWYIDDILVTAETVDYTVTFDEANDLQYVYIRVYNSGEEFMGELETDASGNATIDLPNDTYDFYAYMDEYMNFEGNFTVSGGSQTVPFEMIPVPFVTFNETNGLSDIWIDVYADSALTDYIDGLWTDQFGQGTMEIYESGTYYYEARMTGYGDLVGNFTISVSNITESFTMENGYYVLFTEDNSEMAILQLFSDSSLTIPASSPFATNEGGNATRELANGTYYYKAMRVGFNDCTGNFTVSGEVVYEHFQMIPMAGVIFAEDFLGVAGGYLPVGWTTNSSSLCYVYGTSRAGGFVPELQLYYGPGGDTYHDYYVATPPINATGTVTSLNLSFKSYFWLYGDDLGHLYTYAVQMSDDDGATWTSVLEESPTFDTYPHGYFQRTENIDLSAWVGQTIRICWRLYGYTYWMNEWDIDDILVIGS